jgi:DNA polymerase III subunit chi
VSGEAATEVLFYHLGRQPLDKVLPGLLEKTLERGWRAVVQAGSQERVDALDALLWTYADDSFLPHGTARDGMADQQPVFLTAGSENPNGAAVRFLVDGADAPDLAGYIRAVFIFDGRDEDALAQARAEWKRIKSAGFSVTYWQQNDQGRWEKKA